jgi:hypothetical protein
MKKLSVIVLGALALSFNACEMHKASELADEPKQEEGAAKESAAAEHGDKEKGEAKPGEAPKFFPEKK